MFSKTVACDIYQVLITECGAPESGEAGFVAEFNGDDAAREWRFQGKLGFGGKFYSREMMVSCYREDETPDRLGMIDAANARLKQILIDTTVARMT